VGRDGAGKVGGVGQVVDVVVLAGDVGGQTQRIVEALLADGAALRLLGVRVAVGHVLPPDGERFAAGLAIERLLPGVCQHMLPEAALLPEGGRTQLALGVVPALVLVQIGNVAETHGAVGATVRALVNGM